MDSAPTTGFLGLVRKVKVQLPNPIDGQEASYADSNESNGSGARLCFLSEESLGDLVDVVGLSQRLGDGSTSGLGIKACVAHLQSYGPSKPFRLG